MDTDDKTWLRGEFTEIKDGFKDVHKKLDKIVESISANTGNIKEMKAHCAGRKDTQELQDHIQNRKIDQVCITAETNSMELAKKVNKIDLKSDKEGKTSNLFKLLTVAIMMLALLISLGAYVRAG